tara:strand:+ start:670 stop:918 length:249 start_codon:yes stop_codon:yes gene_type:complete
MKNDRESILSTLRKERFTDLLRLYNSIQKKTYLMLSKEELNMGDLVDMVKQYLTLGELVDKSIQTQMKGIERERMFSYAKKK